MLNGDMFEELCQILRTERAELAPVAARAVVLVAASLLRGALVVSVEKQERPAGETSPATLALERAGGGGG
jgi:hypothetical protein